MKPVREHKTGVLLSAEDSCLRHPPNGIHKDLKQSNLKNLCCAIYTADTVTGLSKRKSCPIWRIQEYNNNFNGEERQEKDGYLHGF